MRPRRLEQSHFFAFLVGDELERLGGDYSRTEDWQPCVVRDGLLITGQNPASSGPVAEALIKLTGTVGA